MTFDLQPFRHLYPFTSHWLLRDGLRYHYVDEGAGEPVVLVHGNPTWSFFFRTLISALRGSQRVIAPDHIGCGLSDKPGDARYEYMLERRVADLEALLDKLKLDNITWVLHDWGGMIGLAAALRRPERIGRVVLLNTAAFLIPAGHRLPWPLWVGRHVPLVPALLVRGLNLFARATARVAVARPLPPDVRAAYLAPYDSWDHRIATLRFVQDIPLHPGDRSYELAHWVDEHLERLTGVPMLICWGRRDFVFDTAILGEWQRRFPEAEVRTFPQAGHYLLEDEPHEVTRSVCDFLRRHALAASRSASAEGAA